MSAETWLSIAIFIVVPINWWASLSLWRLARANPELVTLRERAFAAVVLSVAITIFAVMTVLVTINAVDLTVVTIVRRASVLLLAMPAIYWLWLARRD